MSAVDPSRLRLLVVVRHLGVLRHYEEVVAALVRSGIAVTIGHGYRKDVDEEGLDRLLRSNDTIRVKALSRRDEDPRELLTQRLRELVDLLRYEHPDYAESHWLRQRAYEDAPPGVKRWSRRVGRLGYRGSAAVTRLVLGLDGILPPPETAVAVIEEERPDVVVASPVVWPGSAQVDVLKAAARQGIPTAVWIPSWDNLTNKGLLRFVPDRVFVWNPMQRDELLRYHAVPEDRIVVTGAQTFDRWFSESALSPREELCARLALDPDRPFILYLASSFQLAPREPEFFERWLAAVRASGDPQLERASILVRPHPTMVRAWLAQKVDRFPAVAVSPSTPEAYLEPTVHDEYRDALRHCAVAVGLNTSAMIEAAIFGVPVCTPELPELADRQHGTLHFRHLVRAGGGLLHLAPTLEEHVAQLGELLRRDSSTPDEKSERFVRAFIRPHGLDTPAAPLFAAEMRALFGRTSAVPVPRRVRRLLGSLVARAAAFVGAPLEERPLERIAAYVVASAVVPVLRLRVARRQAVRSSRRALWIARRRARRAPRRMFRILRRTVRASRHVMRVARARFRRAPSVLRRVRGRRTVLPPRPNPETAGTAESSTGDTSAG